MGLLKLIFTLGLNKSGFEAGLKGVGQTTNRFADELHGKFASLFTIGAITAWGTHVAKAAMRIKDLAEQTKLTTDEVQKADQGLEQSGLQFEDMTTALNRLSTARREAVQQAGEMRESFKSLGIGVGTLNDSSVRNFDIMMKLAEAMRRGNITAKDQALIMDVLGPKAAKLANVLGELAKYQPPKLIREEDIEAIDRADKALKRLQQTASAGVAPFLGTVADVLTGSINFVADSLGPNGKKKDRKGLMEQIAAVGMKDRVEAAGKGIGDVFKDLLNAGLGIKPKAPPPLFEVGQEKSSFDKLIRPSDSLVSVGNFLGQDPGSAVRSQIKEITTRLDKIEANTKRVANNAIIINK